jgi:phage/plasmid-like protein (TIGR03299 family)
MFSVKQTPWHGLGHIVHEAPSSLEAMRLAGLDWTVKMEALFCADGAQVPDRRACRRSSDGRILGVVGNVYTPLQNADAFGFFDPLIEAGEAMYETAGSLMEGSRVWVLARINRDPSVIVPGDEIAKYVLLSNGHDGRLSASMGFTGIRVVCANTMAQAHSDASSKLVRVYHHKKIVENLEALRASMDLANESFEMSAESYRALARRSINTDDLKKYVNTVFATKRSETRDAVARDGGDEAPGRARILNDVTRLFETGHGSDIEGVRGTYWGAYNAVTEYLSYERGTDEDTRLNNLWYGQGERLNQKALDTALQYAYVQAA